MKRLLGNINSQGASIKNDTPTMIIPIKTFTLLSRFFNMPYPKYDNIEYVANCKTKQNAISTIDIL